MLFSACGVPSDDWAYGSYVKVNLKGCVRYIFTSLFFKSKIEHLQN